MTEQPGQPEPGSTPGWAPPGGQQPPPGPYQPPQQPPQQQPPQQQPPQQPGGWGAPPPPQPGWGTPQQPPPQQGWGAAQQAPPGWGGQQGWAGQPPPPQAPKPGVVPLRPLGFGEILDGAFTTIQRYPKILLGLAAIVMTVIVIIGFGALFIGSRDVFLAQTDDDFAQIGDSAWFSFAISIGVLSILLALATTALTGMITITVGRGVLGQPITVGEAWRAASPHLLRLIGYSLALTAGVLIELALAGLVVALIASLGPAWAAIAVGVLLLLGSIVLIYFVGIRLIVGSAVLVLETNPVDPNFPQGEQRRVGIFAAMARSWRLIKGRSWRTLGLAIVAGLIAGVVTQILQIGFFFLGTLIGLGFGESMAGPLFTAVIGGVGYVGSLVIQIAFLSAVNAIIYVDARMRTEGLDIELAQAATAGYAQPTPWVTR